MNINKIIFFILMCVPLFALADCTWDGATINDTKNISVNLHDMGDTSNYVLLVDFPSHLKCKVGTKLSTYLGGMSSDGQLKNILKKQGGSFYIKGNFSNAGNTLFSFSSDQTQVLTVDNHSNVITGGNEGEYVPIYGQLSLQFPAGVRIPAGTELALARFYADGVNVTFSVSLGSAYTGSNDHCTVNSGKAININFGEVDVMSVPSTLSTNKGVQENISISCNNSLSKSLNLYLEGMASSFLSSKPLSTSNENLGVFLTLNDKNLTVGTSVPIEVKNGVDNELLNVNLVRNPQVSADNISLGDFNSAAVIVLSLN